MVEQVIQVCADVFHVSVENIKGRNRNRLFSDARRTAFALALEVYSNRNRVITFVDLAERVGKRDHSTVSYSVKTFHHLCKTDTEYNRKVLQCRTRLGLIKTGVFCKDCGNPVQHKILELCNDCYALRDANELETIKHVFSTMDKLNIPNNENKNIQPITVRNKLNTHSCSEVQRGDS